MARCPNCGHSFRVPEGDQPDEHYCPACGYEEHDEDEDGDDGD